LKRQVFAFRQYETEFNHIGDGATTLLLRGQGIPPLT